MIERSKTPLLPEKELLAMGFNIILYANAAMQRLLGYSLEELQRLRFGARETWPEPEAVFRRARTAAAPPGCSGVSTILPCSQVTS